MLDQPPHQRVGRQSFGFGVKVQNQSMPQHGSRDRLHIVQRRMRLSAQDRTSLRSENQTLAGSRAGSPSDEVAHEGWGVTRCAFAATGQSRELQRIPNDMIRDRYAQHDLL